MRAHRRPRFVNPTHRSWSFGESTPNTPNGSHDMFVRDRDGGDLKGHNMERSGRPGRGVYERDQLYRRRFETSGQPQTATASTVRIRFIGGSIENGASPAKTGGGV
ncbi:hypothetical protein PISL3812_09948 [Talaromyces islandicus]|uniref:Uncharacterized protein n=1 Tax=Talaromyces islandicus TaxID=28573 RepID=A0A0U1MB90_TALIS|nr:hypothetical protein PISL3812_09948 [Talaromyces islandicus]